MRIGIIGGGAAGMVAAIACSNENNEVIILERNQECGKKILITGNGRCNYWNLDQDLIHYESSTPELKEVLIDNSNCVLDFFDSLGIVPKIKNGYYYPFSNQATTIKNALINEVKRNNITIINDCLVTKISKEKNKFNIETENKIIKADKVVISTGSYAAPKTGSTGMGYEFLKKFNHFISRIFLIKGMIKG